VFPKIGVPQNGWFIENPIKIDDLGVPLFFGNTHIVDGNTSYTTWGLHVTRPCKWDDPPR